MKYILDTSVLVDDPNAIYRFTNSEVIIPIVVLEELDKLKKHAGEAGKNARVAIKLLDEISFNKDFKGIQLKDGITLSVLIDPKTKEYGDNRILDVAKSLKQECTIVSNDFNLRIRARALGMKAESYQSTSNATYGVYLGMREWNDPSLAAELNAKTYIEASEIKDAHENEFIIFDANTIGRKTKDKIKLVNRKYPWGLTPRSIEQTCAIDLLMDPDIKLVTLIGKAGSGKSLISLAAALEQTVNKKEYTKSIIYRLMQAVGNDIGFLPGEKKEKLEPWFQAIYDSFEVLLSKGKSTEWRKQLDYFVEKKQCIELDAITYIRGRSMPNSFILLDEAQNSSKDEIKTLLTRAGAGTKIVLTGDIEQIDRSDLDALNNGITHVIDKFKDSSLAGHITLLKGERSELANEAANIL